MDDYSVCPQAFDKNRGHSSKTKQEIRWLFLSKASAPGHEHTVLLREAGDVSSHEASQS